jgi:putative peptidoglycan lipid II flippase
LPSTFALIFSSAFYAQANYRIPALSSTYAVVVNIVLNAIAVFILDQGAASVAVATSVSAWFQCFYLADHLKRLDRGVAWREAFPSFMRVGLAALIAALCTTVFGQLAFNDWGISYLWTGSGELALSRQLLTQLTVCCAEGLCFVAVLLFTAWLLKAEDLLKLIPSRKFG